MGQNDQYDQYGRMANLATLAKQPEVTKRPLLPEWLELPEKR